MSRTIKENKNENDVWFNNPRVLFDKEKLMHLWPTADMSLEDNINSVTKTIIVVTGLGLIMMRDKPLKLIFTTVICLFMLYLYYRELKSKEVEEGKEEFSNINQEEDEIKEMTNEDIDYDPNRDAGIYKKPVKENPYGNVLPNEIKDTPLRKPAPPAYNEKVKKDINDAVKENINDKLFRDLGDNIAFDSAQSQFYTNANTTIPNNQRGFAEFCYGNMASDKENSIENY